MAKTIYLMLIAAMLLSACSAGAVAAAPTFKAPAAPAASASTPQSQPQSSGAQPLVTAITQTQSSGTQPPVPAGEASGQGRPAVGGTPPAEAVAACSGKSAQASCNFSWQKGPETGVCEMVQNQMACSPQHGPAANEQAGQNAGAPGDPQAAITGTTYSIDQAISDKAQGMTIALDALGFLTGDLGSDSFFPPGKVADYWGFQYLRDTDPSQMGHAGEFLTSAAMNMLNVLTQAQRAQLVALAKSQVSTINEYGNMRFVLMAGFRRLMAGELPAGTTGLSEDAVKSYSAKLYGLDAGMSFARAQLMGSLITSLSASQRAYLDGMVGKGMLEWPRVQEPSDLQGLDRDDKVAVMTYAADMFSWYAGSVDADVYFCPERHGTYFGSFYLKDIPAMSKPSYAIPTDLTGNMGNAMLSALTPAQAQLITGLVDIQRPSLTSIVDVRRQIATELRKFKAGGTADSATVASLMAQYGELDGAISYNLAVNFARVNQTLVADQKAKLMALRKEMLGDQMSLSGAFLYSNPIAMPQIQNTDFLFK